MGCSLSPTARALDEGDALYDEGNVRGAMQRYSRVLESDPDNARAAYSMGVAHYTLDEHSQALPYFDRADDRERVEGLIRSLREWDS
jgi:tetratricopeptide (TPR) repeat protein